MAVVWFGGLFACVESVVFETESREAGFQPELLVFLPTAPEGPGVRHHVQFRQSGRPTRGLGA